jgi:hypothetical protein
MGERRFFDLKWTTVESEEKRLERSVNTHVSRKERAEDGHPDLGRRFDAGIRRMLVYHTSFIP